METTALTFGAPVWLWGLLVLPLLAFLYAWSQQRGRALVAKVVAPRLLGQLAGSVSMARRIFRAFLMLAVFALALIALAQPRYGFTQQEVKQKGRDIIVAVDTSRSMLATDVAPNRLTRAKLLTQDLVRLLKGDRIGLVAFAGSAFLQAPLTLDYTAVINALGELDTNVIPKGGTDIAAAIDTAEVAFGKAEGHTRALIIMTDGEELDADGIAAAKKAAAQGIRVFTVGIGSTEGSLIPVRTDEGRQDFIRDTAGKPVQSHLDANRLKEIATATGGFYVPVGPDAAREIFQKGIEPMDLAETGTFAARQPLERYQWPLGFAIGFLVLWLLVGERRNARNGISKHAATAALILASTIPAQAASTGLQEFQNGQYDKARQAFEQRLKSTPNSRELQFDAGASAYKMGDFEQSVAHFTNALLSEKKKLREDAAYNLGNSLVRRGEAAKENKAKKADWKNAIEQYTEALTIDPKNKQASENRDIVKKLLEDLEKQEKKQDQKKDQQNKDQKDQDKKDQKDPQKQDQKDQQNKDQKDQDKKDQKDQQKQDQKDQQNKDQKDQDKKDQKDQQKQDQKDQQNKDQKDQDKKDQKDPQPTPTPTQPQNKENGKDEKPVPTPTPGEKKQGDLKAGNAQDKKDEKQAQQQAAAAEEKEKDGEMSAAQARALLNALRAEEQKVNLIQQQTSQDVLRDW